MTKAGLNAITKRLDTQLPANVSAGSGVNNYWLNERFREMWRAFRPGFNKVLPKSHDPYNQAEMIKRFQLQGLEYGNWLNQEDRYNYFLACEIALFDLQGIMQFGYNIGLSKNIGIAFGARGKSGALAHYEPDTGMINLTRFKEAKSLVNPFNGQPVFGNKTTYQVKEKLFELTGGVGSLGHEYGHAIDYFFGTYVEQDTRYRTYRTITQGRSSSSRVDINYPKNSLRYDAQMIIHKLIWADEKNHTAYYKLLRETGSEYWYRHNEMFARAFEVYLTEKLREKGIRNTFLVKNKYDGSWPYPQGKLKKVIEPYFDSLIRKMRTKL